MGGHRRGGDPKPTCEFVEETAGREKYKNIMIQTRDPAKEPNSSVKLPPGGHTCWDFIATLALEEVYAKSQPSFMRLLDNIVPAYTDVWKNSLSSAEGRREGI